MTIPANPIGRCLSQPKMVTGTHERNHRRRVLTWHMQWKKQRRSKWQQTPPETWKESWDAVQNRHLPSSTFPWTTTRSFSGTKRDFENWMETVEMEDTSSADSLLQ
ncbi:hypothetical protein Tsubulata_002596, partial [Turnera subulata]